MIVLLLIIGSSIRSDWIQLLVNFFSVMIHRRHHLPLLSESHPWMHIDTRSTPNVHKQIIIVFCTKKRVNRIPIDPQNECLILDYQ